MDASLLKNYGEEYEWQKNMMEDVKEESRFIKELISDDKMTITNDMLYSQVWDLNKKDWLVEKFLRNDKMYLEIRESNKMNKGDSCVISMIL